MFPVYIVLKLFPPSVRASEALEIIPQVDGDVLVLHNEGETRRYSPNEEAVFTDFDEAHAAVLAIESGHFASIDKQRSDSLERVRNLNSITKKQIHERFHIRDSESLPQKDRDSRVTDSAVSEGEIQTPDPGV